VPQISIQQSTFERLQRHAKPLLDTSDSVISRALDALEKLIGEDVNSRLAANEHCIDPRALPNLRHTKVLDAAIEGTSIAKPNWNGLVEEMLRRGMERVRTYEKLRPLCPVNMLKGRKEDEGYSYLADIGVSVQGQDANGACRTIVAAALGLGIALDIGFMWRLKQDAVHPGERARIQTNGVKV
jgi:hypothetical protein